MNSSELRSHGQENERYGCYTVYGGNGASYIEFICQKLFCIKVLAGTFGILGCHMSCQFRSFIV